MYSIELDRSKRLLVISAVQRVTIEQARQAGLFQDSAHYENDNSSIKKFDEPPPLRAFLLIPFLLACFALSPQARAVCQEGCDIPNFTEGVLTSEINVPQDRQLTF